MTLFMVNYNYFISVSAYFYRRGQDSFLLFTFPLLHAYGLLLPRPGVALSLSHMHFRTWVLPRDNNRYILHLPPALPWACYL